jgi:transcriptional regulator with XRE-family HTH domain
MQSAKKSTKAAVVKKIVRKASDRHPLSAAFGEYLKRARIERGKSQEELAHDAALDRTYISLLERGYSAPTLLVLDVLSKNLDYSLGDFMSQFDEQLPRALRRKTVARRANEHAPESVRPEGNRRSPLR